MVKALRLAAHRSQLTAAFSLLTAVLSSRFVIPDSRFGFLRAIPVLLALLTVAIVSPLHAATPGFDTLVNYDTAWTYVYDGGKSKSGATINDIFYDVKCLPNGTCVCVGQSGDTSNMLSLMIVTKIDATGKVVKKKLFTTNSNNADFNREYAHSLAIAKNGDFIIGGARFLGPYVLRTDSLCNIKWAKWYYDSTKGVSGNLLHGSGVINSLRETIRGTIICAAGDVYPDNGQGLSNYAAMIEFDSLGRSPYDSTQPCYVNNEFNLDVGYNIDGFYIDETKGKNFVLSGYQSVYYTDSLGNPLWKSNYTFSLAGVGTVKNNISRAKVLRDNTLIVAGQAYEGNCWTKYKTLYYDAWWSPVNYGSGLNTNWDTAGRQGGSDGLYDFTQLNNGNVVFIGNKATVLDSGVWAFVTDSTGKKLLWEKQYNLPGVDAGGNPLTTVTPLSVCATPDGGFTMVGDNNTYQNNHNAFAMHFVSKPISAVMYRGNFQAKSLNGFSVRLAGAKLLVSNTMSKIPATVSLFDVLGRCVVNATSPRPMATPLPQERGEDKFGTIQLDISHLAHGMYVVRVKAGSIVQSATFVY